MDELKVKAEQLANEVTAAKAEAAAAKQEVANIQSTLDKKSAELDEAKTSINNLDASIKEQQKTIDALRVEVKASKITDFKSAFRAALEERKSDVEALVKKGAEKFTVEVKTVNNIGTTMMPNGVMGLQLDTNVHAAVPAANAFIVAFGLRPRTGNKLAWLEATSQNGADYVGELAQNNKASDVTVTEKTRLFGKLATTMKISTEVENWFEELYNYCVNEGVRLIESKLDAEIYGGDGDDSTAPSHIYGVKGAATAFSALAAGKVSNANIADVILDATSQIAKEGFAANLAFVTWAEFAELKEVKSTTGAYLYDAVTGMLGGVRIVPSSRLSSGEILVADSSCVEVVAGNNYELEFIRDGVYDAYDVYFRKAAQVKVPTPKKKGLIYVASVTTAIAALQTA